MRRFHSPWLNGFQTKHEQFKQKKSLQFILLLVIFYLLNHFIVPAESNILWRLPPLLKWFPLYINDSIGYLMFEWWPIEVYDPDIQEFEQKPLVSQFTRVISGFILFQIEFIREIMLGGAKTVVTFSSWDWVTANPWARMPGLPWTVIAGGATILGYALAGRRLALLVGLSMTYISVFGQWEPAMQTLSFVLVAAPVSVFIGLILGIWAFRNKTVEAVLNPLLNMAQIIPHFSYLIPVMVFFGIGDHAGAIATVIFATPPMVRLTLLGLKKLGPEVAESGMMSGCTNWQLLTNVLVPTARRDILIGVNQVIMQCLAMVVLASLIGAKGLGIDLLIALNRLDIGKATEIGICIVLIAIVLDRMSLAWANKQTDYFSSLSFIEKHKYSLLFAALFVIALGLAYVGQFIFPEGFNYLYIVPHNKGMSIAIYLQSGVDWIWDTYFFALKVFNEWLILSVLLPVKAAYLGMPVIATFTLFMGIGFIVGGLRVALTVGALLLFIALTQWWDRALITAYLMSVSVLVSGIIGITVGTLCAQNARSTRFILTYCDTFQTFPSFIYLIPVMMLFGITDTAVVITGIK